MCYQPNILTSRERAKRLLRFLISSPYMQGDLISRMVYQILTKHKIFRELKYFIVLHTSPQVTAGSDVYRCSDRSAAYEIQNLLQGGSEGGSELCRNLLMYGTPDLGDVSYTKQHLFPAPLGGLEAATPQTGWSFVQIPGALRNSFSILCDFNNSNTIFL